MRAAWNALLVDSIILIAKAASGIEWNISFVEMNAVSFNTHSECFTGKKVFVKFDLIKSRITEENIWKDLWVFVEETAERWDKELGITGRFLLIRRVFLRIPLDIGMILIVLLIIEFQMADDPDGFAAADEGMEA